MADAGVAQTAIDVFSHYYGQLEEGVTGTISEETIEPYLDPPLLEDVSIDPGHAKQVFDQLAIINLNGGLGTSMGLDQAKSLLPVRDGKSFLDIIVEQVLAARRGTGSRLPLIFMNSFRTREDTLEVLAKYPDLPVGDLPLDFLQNKEPKLRTDDLTPVDWDADPDARVVPARPRRHLYGPADLGAAPAAAGCGLQVRLGLQLGQPRHRPQPRHRLLVRSLRRPLRR